MKSKKDDHCYEEYKHLNPDKLSIQNFYSILYNSNNTYISICEVEFPANWMDNKSLIYIISHLVDSVYYPAPEVKNCLASYEIPETMNSTICKESLRLLNGYIINRYPCDIYFNKEEILNNEQIIDVLSNSLKQEHAERQ